MTTQVARAWYETRYRVIQVNDGFMYNVGPAHATRGDAERYAAQRELVGFEIIPV